jgi:hypothetical protein
MSIVAGVSGETAGTAGVSGAGTAGVSGAGTAGVSGAGTAGVSGAGTETALEFSIFSEFAMSDEFI